MLKKLNTSLNALRDFKQFTLWMLTDDGRKMPIDYRTLKTYELGSDWQNDEDAVTDADTVEKIISQHTHFNIAFLLKKNDPFFFLDIDKCMGEGKPTSPVALSIINQLEGCALEVSSSKTGYHIIGKTTPIEHKCRNKEHGLELYTERRFIALTGFNASGDANTQVNILSDIVNQYFRLDSKTENVVNKEGPVDGWDGIKDDEELIKKACESGGAASIFGSKCSFKDLYERNEDIILKFYDDGKGNIDESLVDAALAQHLAFWTGADGNRIKSIMLNSKHKRKKWDRPDGQYGTYLDRTIHNACIRQKEYHSVRKKTPLIVENKDVQVISENVFMNIQDQINLFNGCVYVTDEHKVITPSGHMLKMDQFNVAYGGHNFFIDHEGTQRTTKAWKAFTESQGLRWPKVQTTCFKPLEESMEIIEENGIKMINAYKPVEFKRKQGDASLFLTHLEKILPNERDRSILLAYMAACVQHVGHKFQWCPLIIGAPGNGKTLITRCIIKALGEQYSHMPLSNELNEKYNAWLFNKLFIGIEDVYVPEHKAEVVEVLKPMITNDRIACRAMYADQKMMDNCANFILNSNHMDGLRKHKDDRRLCVFHTAQLSKEELMTDGMDDAYFCRLYSWLNNDGYEIVTDYLLEYDIPDEFNPKPGFCNVAPVTTSTDRAIESSMGAVEQEIIEVIDEDGTPGMCGGWVSSKALDDILKDMRATRLFPRKKRKDLMASIGFIPHPSLDLGRSHIKTKTDGIKATLYIRVDHKDVNQTDKRKVVELYDEEQEKVCNPFFN